MDSVVTITLRGQMPSGKGMIQTAVIRGRLMRYPNPRFKAWRVKAFQEMQNQRGRWPRLEEVARVSVRYYPGDRIRRDVPGIIDALCHLLEYCPVCRKKNKTCNIPFVADDSLLAHWDWKTMDLDRENPRIEFTIGTCR